MEIARMSLVQIISYKAQLVGGLIFLLLAVAALGLWHAGNISFSGTAAMTNRINILESGWEYMPGVTPLDNGLYVSYLGRSIVQQDGSPGQTNPAVNLYGSHLRATDNFTLTAAITDRKGTASFRLYATPPTVQDEFRVEPKSLDFIINDTRLTLNEWHGSTHQNPYLLKPAKSSSFALEPSATQTLTMRRAGDKLNIAVNGRKVADINYANYFDKDIWFGLSALDKNDNWRLSDLTVESAPNHAITSVDTQNDVMATKLQSPQALQELATTKRPDFLIGAATSLTPLVNDDDYRNIAFGGNFGATTTENALKWQFIHPQKNTYDFKEADAFVNIAKKNNMQVQGHTLVFGEANPKWVQDLPATTPADKEAIKNIMIDHITRTVTHFKDRIYAWDVVNEPLAADFSDATSLRQHKWLSAMGEDYIATAFNAAHQAAPNAKLYINDFGLEEDGERWDAMLRLVTKLKSQGVPIDGVGFESHVYQVGDEIDPTILQAHIQQLEAIGISSHISEMDVHEFNGAAAQAKQYADVLNVCISEPSCTSWTTWGISDRYNIYKSDAGTLQFGKDFLWNDQFDPKPAVMQMQNTLKKSS